ncbi:MAG: preprotein translocase subunit SecY [Vampirovibrio sp.]|nr:preprotein translocase subunit SecY [Vampirovibrio sp.]
MSTTAKPKSAIPSLGDLTAMWQASGLKEKLLFTIIAIVVFRFGAQIPIWGASPEIAKFLAQQGQGALLGLLDMFSGGALSRVSVLALGIGPYITASIIMQLLTVVIPRLEELQKEEGEQGRRKISQYTRYLTVGLAMLQGTLFVKFITSMGASALAPGVEPWLFFPLAVLCLTAGAVFSLWLAEMITERGVGNGGSLLIFVGIITQIPVFAKQTAELVGSDPQKSFNLVVLLAIYLACIGLIIILQEAVRKIFIVSAKRQVGNKMYGGQNSFIPFKINPAGVMPIIFAYAILAFPMQIVQFVGPNATGFMAEVVTFFNRYFAFGQPLALLTEFVMIVFFTFFYASIIPSMQPREIAKNLQKYGSSIPGIKPGKPTADKLEQILTRTTFIGAFGLAFITLLASLATTIADIRVLQGLGSTSLIIMVGVALDTMNQIRVHLLARQYEGFLR